MPTAEKIYAMPGNENLWQTAAQCHRILADADIPYTVCGGVAVCLHGYQRNTVDLDLKIACGLGSLRRTHKDFADVVELIAMRHFDGSFARHLHKSVRNNFRKLVRNANGAT